MLPQAAALKLLLDQPGLHVMPGCGDGMGARLIAEAGFRIGFVSGSSVSAMRLAMPDMDLLSFAEMADAVETCIAAAPDVLWLADGDTGYGNALAVQRTIRAYARRGADILFLDSPQAEAEMRETVAACGGKPALAVTSPAGKHFMPGNAELERIGIKLVVYPQEILAATVHAIRAALGGLKGGAKPSMASPAELATAVRSADYLAQDARWPDPG
jgi:2-methylisocitrate lyase-like PEP mutase family enzyme